MSHAKVFPPGTTVREALEEILQNADDVVKGAVVGMMGMMTIVPTYGVNLSTVVDVQDLATEELYDGYMISITPSVETASQPYDEVCKVAVVQRFIALDNEGCAFKFLPVGGDEMGKVLNKWIN